MLHCMPRLVSCDAHLSSSHLTTHALTPWQIIPTVIQVISAPDSRAPTNVDATENAISAFVKIARCVVWDVQHSILWSHSNPIHDITPEQSIPLLMEWLPVTEDDEEAAYIYDYLSDFILAYVCV